MTPGAEKNKPPQPAKVLGMLATEKIPFTSYHMPLLAVEFVERGGGVQVCGGEFSDEFERGVAYWLQTVFTSESCINIECYSMFDNPVFKKLSHNDTGAAKGHQGGIVIPKDLEEYFPDVKGTITKNSPTADVEVNAVLYHDGKFLGQCTTRYQYQTWGGTRSPERRLTSNLGPLRNMADEDDIILFERDIEDSASMRLTLIKVADSSYLNIEKLIGKERWGILNKNASPVSNQQFNLALDELEKAEIRPFELLTNKREFVESKTLRSARSVVFRKKLLNAHGNVCAITGNVMVTPNGLNNLDAAHIVPVANGGSDDPRNGLLMSKDFHWAFDRGIFSIGTDLKIVVEKRVLDIPSNRHLKKYVSKSIIINSSLLEPHQNALKWHRDNVAIR